MPTPTPSEEERYRYLKLKQKQLMADQQQQPQATQQPEQQVNPNRFQLKSNQPYDNYSYGDAAKDTLKTLINSVADLGQNVSQPIMHPGQTLQGLGQAVTHPLETVGGIGQYIGNRYGSVDKAATTVATDPFGFGSDVVMATTAAKGVGSVPGMLKNDKLAGNVINSLIKPSHKEFMFGKNPGQAVAKEGLIANNLESLGNKVNGRIEEIKQAISEIRSTPENINKSVDLNDIRSPLVKSLEKLKKTPRTNAQEISDIKAASADIEDLVTNMDKVGLGKLPVSSAYQIKEAVSKMQKWNRDTSVGTELNKSLKQVYHIIDSKIDTAIPELKNLNGRMSNLISAKQSIINRAEILSKQEGMPTLGKLLDLPFAAMKTPGAKTVLGKLLAKQYALPKK